MTVTPLRPGDPGAVGPHRLLGRLGEGGMGTVYLAVSPDERAVAVKVLRATPLDGSETAHRRFRQELDALRRVRGSHLVELLDADVEADPPYLVTRFVPGVRLDRHVEQHGPLEPAALRALARGLADALAALHGQGVVHRDLTPGNVLLADGAPQLIDLGLATVTAARTALTGTGMVVGTPGYLAPEQVTGTDVTPAVDVHAWGATVAYAGTGRPPYGTGRPEAVLYRIVHEDPDLDGLPGDVRALVEAATDPDPARRPAATELLAELGGPSSAVTRTLHLPRDVDATTVLAQHPEWAPTEDEEAYDALPRLRRPLARGLQVVVTALLALAVVATAALVAPVVAATVTLLAVVILRAVTRSADRLALRRDRRGGRRRDPLLAVLGAPWHLLAALLDVVVSVPLLALVAGPPAAAVWFLEPTVNGLETPELTAATATVIALVAYLSRRGSRRPRRALADALVTATPSAAGAVAVAAVLAVSAVLLLATAEGSAPTWWPVP
ncbi:MAG: serine/threonine protein kinase [Frankiales bacterium]|nr:MAG: serine/threonine protein kinase [Frankiales bacterium]